MSLIYNGVFSIRTCGGAILGQGIAVNIDISRATFFFRGKTLRPRELTCLHELLRNSGAINVPSDDDQRHAAHERQQEDFEQLQLKVVEREQCYQLVVEFAELQRRPVVGSDDVAEIEG